LPAGQAIFADQDNRAERNGGGEKCNRGDATSRRSANLMLDSSACCKIMAAVKPSCPPIAHAEALSAI